MAYEYNLAPKSLSEQCAAFKKKYPTLDDLPADEYIMMPKYDGCLAIINTGAPVARQTRRILAQQGALKAEPDNAPMDAIAGAAQIKLMTTGQMEALQSAAQRWLDLPSQCCQVVEVPLQSEAESLAAVR